MILVTLLRLILRIWLPSFPPVQRHSILVAERYATAAETRPPRGLSMLTASKRLAIIVDFIAKSRQKTRQTVIPDTQDNDTQLSEAGKKAADRFLKKKLIWELMMT
jgi:hypothetical protein